MVSLSRRKYNRICLRRVLPGLIVLFLLLGTSSALAFDVCVNGSQIELASRPTLRQAKVMVPLNCLADALGVSIEPTSDETLILLYMGSREVQLFLDQPQVSVDGKAIDLGVAPYMAKDALMVPLNFFHDVIGIGVQWDEGGQILYMGDRPEAPANQPAPDPEPREPTAKPEPTPTTTSKATPAAIPGPVADPEPVEMAQTYEDQEAIVYTVEPDAEKQSPNKAGANTPFRPIIHLEREGLALSQFLKEVYRGPNPVTDEALPERAEGPRLTEVSVNVEEGRQRLDFVSTVKVEVEPMLLGNPARLVLDIPGVTVDVVDDEIYVGQGIVHGVRLSQYAENVTRAVVDLAEATGYQISPLADGHGFSVIFNQRVGRASLWRSGSTLRLGLETSGPVLYSVSKLKAPDRMVIDVANATFVAGSAEVMVNDTAVKKLRISQYTPTSTRIVLDLAHAIDIGDIEVGTKEGTVELVFIDRWTQSMGGGQLAAVGRGFRELFPSSKARAAVEMQLTDVSSASPGPQGKAGIDDVDEDKPYLEEYGIVDAWGNAVTPDYSGLDEYNLDSPVFPAIRRSDVDFSRWPALQVNWLEPRSLAALRGKTVLVDPGHGGLQPGAPGVEGVPEKSYNLAMALRVGELLQWAGANVSYTRIADQTVSLRERVDAVQAVDADILLSIHANASLTRDATGTETLYHPGRPADRLLASALQENVVSQLGILDRGVKQRNDLYILRHSPVPSALVEVGFLDHAEEGVFLLTPEAIDKASMGLVRGVAAFFRDIDLVERVIDGQMPKGPNGVESSDGARSSWEDGTDGDTVSEEDTPGRSAGSDTLE